MAEAGKKQAIQFAETRLPDLGGAGTLPFLHNAPPDLFMGFPALRSDEDKKALLVSVLGQVQATGLCFCPVPLVYAIYSVSSNISLSSPFLDSLYLLMATLCLTALLLVVVGCISWRY